MSRARFVAIVLAAGCGGLMAGGLSAANGLGAVKRLILPGALLSPGAYACKNERFQAALSNPTITGPTKNAASPAA